MTREQIRRVVLNRHELRMVGGVALEHHVENIVAGRRDTAWGNGLDLTARTRAYWAEYAVAKTTGRAYEPRTWEQRHDGDVRGLEVKHSPKVRELPVRPRDLENEVLAARPFVLVAGEGPAFYVVGWRYGHEARELGVEKAPDPSKPPALFIPWELLRPVDELEPVLA